MASAAAISAQGRASEARPSRLGRSHEPGKPVRMPSPDANLHVDPGHLKTPSRGRAGEAEARPTGSGTVAGSGPEPGSQRSTRGAVPEAERSAPTLEARQPPQGGDGPSPTKGSLATSDAAGLATAAPGAAPGAVDSAGRGQMDLPGFGPLDPVPDRRPLTTAEQAEVDQIEERWRRQEDMFRRLMSGAETPRAAAEVGALGGGSEPMGAAGWPSSTRGMHADPPMDRSQGAGPSTTYQRDPGAGAAQQPHRTSAAEPTLWAAYPDARMAASSAGAGPVDPAVQDARMVASYAGGEAMDPTVQPISQHQRAEVLPPVPQQRPPALATASSSMDDLD